MKCVIVNARIGDLAVVDKSSRAAASDMRVHREGNSRPAEKPRFPGTSALNTVINCSAMRPSGEKSFMRTNRFSRMRSRSASACCHQPRIATRTDRRMLAEFKLVACRSSACCHQPRIATRTDRRMLAEFKLVACRGAGLCSWMEKRAQFALINFLHVEGRFSSRPLKSAAAVCRARSPRHHGEDDPGRIVGHGQRLRRSRP